MQAEAVHVSQQQQELQDHRKLAMVLEQIYVTVLKRKLDGARWKLQQFNKDDKALKPSERACAPCFSSSSY